MVPERYIMADNDGQLPGQAADVVARVSVKPPPFYRKSPKGHFYATPSPPDGFQGVHDFCERLHVRASRNPKL